DAADFQPNQAYGAAATATFRIDPNIPSPTLVSPGAGAIVNTATPSLQWSPVNGAVNYNIFLQDTNAGAYSLPPLATTIANTTTPTFPLTGFVRPAALTFDSKGNLFVSDTDTGRIFEFAPGMTTPLTNATLTIPWGDDSFATAFDKSGNLFAASYWESTVLEF